MLRLILSVFMLLATASCTSPTQTPLPTHTPYPTYTSYPTYTHYPTYSPFPSQTPSPVSTPTITPTHIPESQPLKRVFPEEFHGQTVWSNADGDSPEEVGWFNFGQDYVIHHDVSLPTNGFARGDPVISPADGVVEKIYTVGDEGDAVVIRITSSISGLELLFQNYDELNHLTRGGEWAFNYSVKDINSVFFHFAHILPYVEQGQKIKTGEQIAEIYFDTWFTPKLAYVLIIEFNDGKTYQISPCLVSNEAEFCGKCTPGTPYRCP